MAGPEGEPPPAPVAGNQRASEAAVSAPPLPSLRRERMELTRAREIELRDVGGLALEMVRRERFKPDLLRRRCAEVLGLEQRIQELDSLLAAAEVAARRPGAEVCGCGALIVRGAHFCSHCGRPARETPPVVACSHCREPLPADANFCTLCGRPAAFEALAQADEAAQADVAVRSGEPEPGST